MYREEIEEKAILIVEELNADYYDDDNPLYRKADVMYACMQMAEWVQEQCEAEIGELRGKVSELIGQLDEILNTTYPDAIYKLEELVNRLKGE